MSIFKYTKGEQDINKVLKMNLDESQALRDDAELADNRKKADAQIESSIQLLSDLGKQQAVNDLTESLSKKQYRLENQPATESWNALLKKANAYNPNSVTLEDIMTKAEIRQIAAERKEIDRIFSLKTGIVNKTDLAFLAIATGLQVAKALIFPYVANQSGYLNQIDKSKRLAHNDKSIETAHRQANDQFKARHMETAKTGYWINLLYQTPPYDITKGSAAMGINMGGAYHRMYTLGHDPILGWLFGTMNILTDTVTLNNFQTFRVVRGPKMVITPESVPMNRLMQESYTCAKADFLNLPAAVFAQGQHLKSDKYTKLGLPVPLLSSFNEDFASTLYKNNYDALCLTRDVKIIGSSVAISRGIDGIIGLVHGLFRQQSEALELYEVRTRKILLISNSIASTANVIGAGITSNPKNLDIGGLLSTVCRLFCDIRFMAKVKKEFIQGELDRKLQREIEQIDKLYDSCSKPLS